MHPDSQPVKYQPRDHFHSQFSHHTGLYLGNHHMMLFALRERNASASDPEPRLWVHRKQPEKLLRRQHKGEHCQDTLSAGSFPGRKLSAVRCPVDRPLQG